MRITLIRHTSVAVERGICYGITDVPLADTFPSEAEIVKKNLGTSKFDAVFTSPLSRCVRLAEYCGFPDATKDMRLREMDFGEWEMQRYSDIQDTRLKEWYDDFVNVRPTGGEAFCEHIKRVEDFFREIRGIGFGDVAAFTHGGTIASALILTGQATTANAFNTPYGGRVTIEV